MASLNEKLQQIESSLDPKLSEFLSELVSIINEKDQVLTTLQKEVCYLNKKVHELERYSSKDYYHPEFSKQGKARLMKETKKIPMSTHSYSNDTTKTPNAKRSRPDSAKPTSDVEITNQLKMLRDQSDHGKLKQYIDMLVGDSPPAKTCNKGHEDETSSSGTPMTD